MSGRRLSRRRVIRLLAAAAGTGWFGLSSRSGESGSGSVAWRGRALGAEAEIVLAGVSPGQARRILKACLAEIARLERIFSLHRADSELVRLNREGRLDRPALELRLLLVEACRYGELTSGAFDVTIQPLWRLYATRFAQTPAIPPSPAEIAAVRRLVDFRAVDVSANSVRMRRPGMAVTLNGIAQGYVTDRIADMLREAGFTQVLVELGETFASGRVGDGRPWRVGIPDPERPDDLMVRLELIDRAVATSSPAGTLFEPSGRHHHLLDPATGTSARRYRAVSVVANCATTADALSTALSILSFEDGHRILRAIGDATAIFAMGDGGIVVTDGYSVQHPASSVRPVRIPMQWLVGRSEKKEVRKGGMT